MKPETDSGYVSRIFRAYKYSDEATVNGARFVIRYTRRARNALEKRKNRLIIEMQIYFSCVVQKRVIFHDTFKYNATPINEKISVALRVVESTSCDPDYFANNHPVRREFTSDGARKMKARELRIDFKKNNWTGEFKIAV